MDGPAWLSQRLADVPPGDAWLGRRERRVLARLSVDRRREAWRLGRWTAKAAVAASTELPAAQIEVLAAADGAPEAWLGDEPLPVSLSLSHRAGRALAVVTAAPRVVGCDLEVVEPRSGAFIREWLTPAEQRLIGQSDERQRPMLANLMWTAKEAASKVRREGLRLDLRGAVVTVHPNGSAPQTWGALEVQWRDAGAPTAGWWRSEPGWVMTVVGDPAPATPRPLTADR